MGLYLTTITGLIIWIVLWSQGTKGFDAFLITILLVLVATGARVVWAKLPGNRPGPDGPLTRGS